jgi:hypothetical protein
VPKGHEAPSRLRRGCHSRIQETSCFNRESTLST